MLIEQTSFKGNPVLVFKRNEEDKFPVAFGVRKAKVILEHIEDIQGFYEQHKGTLKAKADEQPRETA